MAFFDKINDFAKNAREKTNAVIEATKLRARITNEEHNISAITAKIGTYFLAKLDAGEELDEKVKNVYAGITNRRDTIASIKADLGALNVPKEPEAPKEEE
ncbi:MAG: hypothetical protein MJ078_06580 [Clostridia bacterium]|nr:hypothetical protein [Clostridia bacterium]